MRKIIYYILKHKKIAIVGVLIIAFLFLLTRKPDNGPVSPALTPGPEWHELTPGVSIKEDVFNQFGEPISEETVSGMNVSKYRSDSATRNHIVIFQQDTVLLLKEIVTYMNPKKVSDIRTQYGVATNILYGSDSPNGFNLYVFPDKGLAYLGSPESDTILEIWYFSPMSMEQFKLTLAKDYSTTQTSQF